MYNFDKKFVLSPLMKLVCSIGFISVFCDVISQGSATTCMRAISILPSKFEKALLSAVKHPYNSHPALPRFILCGRTKKSSITLMQAWVCGKPMRALVRKTLAYLTARTCLTFVENATATNRVRVFRGDGCYSYVGMIGGVQDLSLADGCNTMGIVAHEFMHALGIFHMQSRHDRDSFITLDLINVPEASKHNYNKLTAAESVNYTPYEYGSVMHYDAQSFATTGNSMKPKNAKYLRTMGSQMISFHDISMINFHYKSLCATKGAACVNGGKRNPKNCNACICPAGYGGALCSLRPAGCGAVLTAAATWKSKKVILGNATNPNLRDTYALCNDWIKAPAGKKVQVQVTVMKNVICLNGCWTQGIEFKTLAAKAITNPRSCCAGQLKQVITSNLNPTPVINYNLYQQSEITYLYRYI
ncbi:unnamed protein product [Haemonchus placei]|uniref:Metalloendopeptidase n=1 Tax=Haemonchus placei TaxID=6290 RepID=A0A0N4VTD8_HAEPC|nr:unnamed protein product [Haemonchus placei]